MWQAFDDFVRSNGGPALPDLEFMPAQPDLGLYVYPEVVDYTDRRPLDDRWVRLDSSVRRTDADVALPSLVSDRPAGSHLVYLSLGSLGSADVDLMRRLVAVLGDTPHRYIVSKGPQHAEYELAPNMWGAEFLPQTKLLPLVDLVITHGGNNTTTEAFHFGKPMVVLPLFWDQYDNAQRVDETGFGVRLPTYAFEDAELTGAIDRLLDGALPARMAGIAREIQRRDGVARAAEAIEALGIQAGAAGEAGR
jgi:UDP:flavonoid glycosyltransferase YjiC (YdhE family)